MAKTRNVRGYRHSAYWYAYHNGWTYSEERSFAGSYLDAHIYGGLNRCRSLSPHRNVGRYGNMPLFDTTFNPVAFGLCLMLDIGSAMNETVRTVTDEERREQMKRELRRNLRIVRRPFYYFRETKRRRQLALERRKIRRRTTTAPMPSPQELLAAWKARKESKDAMIRLGGMLHDLECYVDNCLRFDGEGNVVGRNGGIRGWIGENLPELADKYKTLMRYKAMAKKLRQATGTVDPTPTSALLDEKQPKELISEVRKDFRITFSSLMEAIEFEIDPEAVLAEKKARKGKEKEKGKGKVDGVVEAKRVVKGNKDAVVKEGVKGKTG